MMSPAEFKEQVPGVHAALQSIEDRLDNKFLMGKNVFINVKMRNQNHGPFWLIKERLYS